MGHELLDERVAVDDAEWKGTSRYEVVGNLGRGGMGAVYEVYDRERQELVAVKTVLRFDAASLYLFKKEFRTLTDVHHPNLVHLYELVIPEAGQVFFTMELVRGVSFIDHVRSRATLVPANPESAVLTVRAAPADRTRSGDPSAEARRSSKPSRYHSPADFARLRPALCQLVEGVSALHRAGKLHRDLKPSNVLVTAEGRVVILDFGVATELALRDPIGAERGEIVGTATYMAPEQAFDETPTPASDWYSVGVMLYEALVGRAPFTGPAMDVLQRKTMAEPVAPSLCVDGLPSDLESLCLALLDREPAARPPSEEILRRLGVKHSSAPPPSSRASEGSAALMGRDRPLEALAQSFDAVRAGHPMTVKVAGPSGMGKSSLVHHFLDDLASRSEAVILRGRAYERESVPYKAVDSIIDAVSGHILRLAEDGDPLALPEDAWALGRLFPVLLRVPGLDAPSEEPTSDPKVVRQRAFGALREILTALAARQPVIVFVDDVHWGDVDSATLLLELMRPPDAPPLLLLMTYRDTEAAASPFLAELRERWPDQAEQRDITVGALGADDSRRLALALLGTDDALANRTALAVARESRGSPFLIEELVRSNRGTTTAGNAASLTTLTLEQIVAERLDRLPESARRLINVIAVSGRPLPISVATDASDLDAGGQESVALVCARRFARTGLRGGREVIEMVHERIRETVVAQQEEAVSRMLHRRLALALETGASGDAEAIALHWLATPDEVRGAHFAGIAAEQAATKLAFDKAARLFRLTLEHTPKASPRVHRLRGRLAEVLCLGGRYEESGRAYVAAAENAPPDQRLEFQRAAAQQLLTAGRLDEGSKTLHGLLAALGMRAPRTTLGAVFWIIVYRLWLAIGGLRFKERSESDVSFSDRLRIDALSTVAVGFSVIDLALSNCMQLRHLIEALRRGDSRQVMRAAAIDGAQRAAAGKKPTKHELELNEIARGLADREGTSEAQAFYAGALGMGLFQRGQWNRSSELLDRGLKVGNFSTVGFSNVLIFSANVTLQKGQIREATKRRTRYVTQARDRGDLYTAVNLQTGIGVHCSLAADDPVAARRDLRDALTQWSRSDRDFHVQHWQAMAFEADVDLYEGDGGAAYDRMERGRRALERSFLLQSGFIRALTHYTRGRVAIASIASRPDDRARRIADARRHARALEREYDSWTKVPAMLLRACAENAAGDRLATIAALREAVDRGRETNSGLYLQPAIHCLGMTLGDDEGRALVDGVVATMEAEGVRNLARWIAVFLPGTWGTERAREARA